MFFPPNLFSQNFRVKKRFFPSQYIAKVELLKSTTPKNCILLCLFTQTATWQLNSAILISGIKLIMKAMTKTLFLRPTLGVDGHNFVLKIQEKKFQHEKLLLWRLSGPSINIVSVSHLYPGKCSSSFSPKKLFSIIVPIRDWGILASGRHDISWGYLEGQVTHNSGQE